MKLDNNFIQKQIVYKNFWYNGRSLEKIYSRIFCVQHLLIEMYPFISWFIIGKHLCQNNPCKNGGECYDTLKHYICICAKGFYGAECDKGKHL